MNVVRILSTALISLSLVLSPVMTSAQNNGRRPGSNQDRVTHNQGKRPGGNHNRPSQTRPGNNHNRPGNGNNNFRPGGNHNRPGQVQPGHNHNRPDNGNNNFRPGGNHNRPGQVQPGHNHNRPDNGNHNYRPGGNHNRPGNGNNNFRPGGNHNHRPGISHSRPVPPRPGHGLHRPPVRPHIPAHYHTSWYNRPVPPAHFRPVYRITPLQAILGITLGTALNISISTLQARDYMIQGYDNNCLYLSDIPAMGFNWPDAILYYSGNQLASSTFCYASNYYDTARYNSLFNSLSAQYGAPVSYNRTRGALSATWWGYDNRYITLELQQSVCNDGFSRYMTTLRIG